jgi:ribosomal protein L40E
MKSSFLAGACVLLFSGAVSAEPSKPSQPAAAAKPGAEKKICRRVGEASGTRLGTGRVCKTQAEWDGTVGQRAPAEASDPKPAPLRLSATSAEPSAPSVPAAAVKPGAEKKICRRVGEASGTRLGGGRVCKTQAEWDGAVARNAPAETPKAEATPSAS